jgi:hypothetical protein
LNTLTHRPDPRHLAGIGSKGLDTKVCDNLVEATYQALIRTKDHGTDLSGISGSVGFGRKNWGGIVQTGDQSEIDRLLVGVKGYDRSLVLRDAGSS